jgi:hypothetical protein
MRGEGESYGDIIIRLRSKQKEQSEPTVSASGEVHRKPLQIGERAVVEGAFVRSPQNHSGRLARLERFLPPRRTSTSGRRVSGRESQIVASASQDHCRRIWKTRGTQQS